MGSKANSRFSQTQSQKTGATTKQSQAVFISKTQNKVNVGSEEDTTGTNRTERNLGSEKNSKFSAIHLHKEANPEIKCSTHHTGLATQTDAVSTKVSVQMGTQNQNR